MSDENIDSVSELFLNTDYVIKKFKIGENVEELYTSAAATTDFDLTGQIVWPAAEVISWSLYQTNTDEIKDNISDLHKNQIKIKGKIFNLKNNLILYYRKKCIGIRSWVWNCRNYCC